MTTPMFKTAVGDIVQVPVKFTQKDGAITRQFALTLIGKKCNWDEYREDHDGLPTQEVIKSYLQENVTDWSGQRYVLLENNEPAPFSAEAFAYLLKQPGLLVILFKAYAAESGGKEKN